MQIRFPHTAGKAGCGGSLRKVGSSCLQIAFDRLRRCAVILAAQHKRLMFQSALKRYAVQHAAAKIGSIHRHHQRCVGILSIAGIFAHSVGDHRLLLRGGSHHISSGTHTEGVDPSALLIPPGKLILSFWQSRMSRLFTVQSGVDYRLPLLDAHTHRKWLRLQKYTVGTQLFEGVPRTVTDCQHQDLCRNLSGATLDRLHPSLPQNHTLHLGFKQHLSTQPDDFLSDGFDHPAQQVGPHVRLLPVTYLLRRAVADHLFQYKIAPRVADAGGQLAVRKGSGSPFAELHVGFDIQMPLLPEALHCLHPAVHICAALQYNRTVTQTGKGQGGKHPCRTKAYYHRRMLHRALTLHKFQRLLFLPFDRRSCLCPLQPCHRLLFFFRCMKLKSHRADQQYVLLVSCVHAAFDEIAALNLFRAQLRCFSCRFDDLLMAAAILQSGFDLRNNDRHIRPPFLFSSGKKPAGCHADGCGLPALSSFYSVCCSVGSDCGSCGCSVSSSVVVCEPFCSAMEMIAL